MTIRKLTNTLFFISILFSSFTFGQVGIDTSNPQGTFHVDGGKNNNLSGTPTAWQQADDFIVAPDGKIGIGTTTPAAKLDLKGNMILGAADFANNAPGYSSVMRDNATGELKVASSSSGNSFPINYVTFQINNVNRDWISDYNTNIDTANYTVTIIGSTFTSNNGTKQLVMSDPSYGDFGPANMYAFQNAGTWRLFANYPGATTMNGINGSWTFYCLVINNSIVKNLGTSSIDLAGGKTGSIAIPAGL